VPNLGCVLACEFLLWLPFIAPVPDNICKVPSGPNWVLNLSICNYLKKFHLSGWYGFCWLFRQYVYAIQGGTVNQKRFLGICLIFLILIFIFIQPAYMGPGGIITKALLKNFWGKAALILITISCLPLAIYIYIREEIITE